MPPKPTPPTPSLRPGLQKVLSTFPPTTAFARAADAEDTLHTWLDLVERWNRKLDLTAARGPNELIDLLVADAAHLALEAKPGTSWVDVGTGCGAPGLALALLRPDLKMTLVEPLEKRVSFLRTVIGTLRRTDIKIIRGKGEDLTERGDTFDVALSRATLAPEDWLALGHQLAPSGEVLVLLARGETPIHSARSLIDERVYAWPLTGAERRVARFGTAVG